MMPKKQKIVGSDAFIKEFFDSTSIDEAGIPMFYAKDYTHLDEELILMEVDESIIQKMGIPYESEENSENTNGGGNPQEGGFSSTSGGSSSSRSCGATTSCGGPYEAPDIRLVNDSMITIGDNNVCIIGDGNAVLCTDDKQFQIFNVKNSNTTLLMKLQRKTQEDDVEFDMEGVVNNGADVDGAEEIIGERSAKKRRLSIDSTGRKTPDQLLGSPLCEGGISARNLSASAINISTMNDSAMNFTAMNDSAMNFTAMNQTCDSSVDNESIVDLDRPMFSENIDKNQTKIEVLTDFNDIITLRPMVLNIESMAAIMKDFPCFIQIRDAISGVQKWTAAPDNPEGYISPEELRYRSQAGDKDLRDHLQSSPTIVFVPDRGYQYLDPVVGKLILDTVLMLLSMEGVLEKIEFEEPPEEPKKNDDKKDDDKKDEASKKPAEEKKVIRKETVIHINKIGDLELGFFVSEHVLRTIARNICKKGTIFLDEDRVRELVGCNVFKGPEMTIPDFLAVWTDALPIDFLETGVTAADIKKPFYKVQDKVLMILETSLPRKAEDRLEYLFNFSPLWFGDQLIELISPVIPPDVNPAAWLLKKARSIHIEKKIEDDEGLVINVPPNEKEYVQLYAPKFGRVQANAMTFTKSLAEAMQEKETNAKAGA